MIIIEKVNEKLLNKYIRANDMGIVKAESTEDKATRVQEHQTATVPKDRMSDACSECGGESDLDLESCPFCGAAGVSKDPEPAGEEPAAPPTPGSNAALAAAVGPAPKQKLTKVERDAAKVAAKTALAPAHDASVVPEGVRLLDDAVEKVRVAQGASVQGYYDLGKAMLEIFDGNLWKHRLGADGKPLFRGWNQFAQDELGISSTYSYQIMETSKNFSREDFALIGSTKLVQILRLKPEQRTQLLEEAKAGRMPRKRLLEIVRGEVGEERRDTGRSGGNGGKRLGGAGTKALKAKAEAKTAAKRDREGELTAVGVMGKVKLPLYARVAKGKENKRAASLAQDPWGEEKLANGIVQRYRLVKETKGLVLIIERTREG